MRGQSNWARKARKAGELLRVWSASWKRVQEDAAGDGVGDAQPWWAG